MTSYKKVRGMSDMIQEVVLARRMPPWQPDRNHGVFANGTMLELAEARTLLRWIEQGATRGEGEWLTRLLLGDLGQGALAGVMAEAVGRAAEVPTTTVRRALMLQGDLPALGITEQSKVTVGGSCAPMS